jgi:hypothetical protein
MSSIAASYAQRKTKTLLPRLPTSRSNNSIDVYLQSDLDTWVQANPGKIVKVGNVYSVPGTSSGSTLIDVLSGYNGATQLEWSKRINILGDEIDDNYYYKSIDNFGKKVYIGNGVNSELLVLCRVQNAGDDVNNSGPDVVTGYVMVENQIVNLTKPRFYVQVSAGGN